MDELTTEAQRAHRVRSRLASNYAGRGWAILPTRGKRPILEDWPNETIADPIEARDAWHERGPYAGCNIAIACGPSELVVLDIDLKDGRDGFESLRELGINLPETYSVTTPTGGLHMYYQAPEGVSIQNSANVLGSGIDVRADGGIVIAAGSETPKGRYEVASNLPIAALPTALAMQLVTKSGGTRRKNAKLPEVIPQGEREDTLVRMAGAMRRQGFSAEGMRAALAAENEARCVPPLEDEAIERISTSVARYEPAGSASGAADDPIEVDPDLLAKTLVAMETQRVATETMKTRASLRQREILGGMAEPMDVLSFLDAGPDPVTTCIWGNAIPGGVMGWAANQGVIIAGPPGTGKSTIALQIILRRVGILGGDVLGMPVVVSEEPVVYLALDRADQIRQSIRRMVPDDLEPEIRQRLQMIDSLPPSIDLRQPETFISWLKGHRAGAVVLDSAKDLGFDLNDSSEGQAFNFLVQATLRAGIQILVTHHSRKVPRGDKKPLTLNDLHGSQWVAAGAGSVIMLDGEAGPQAKRMVHVKPLTVPMAPLMLTLDAATGEVSHREPTEDDEVDSGESARRGGLQDRIMAALRIHEPQSNAELCRDLGSNSGSISKACTKLYDRGLIEKVPGGWCLEESRDEIMDEVS